MYKWYFASLSSYELVVVRDLDVELLPLPVLRPHVAARWKATWDDVVPLTRKPRVYASNDHWSPFNGGLWTSRGRQKSCMNTALSYLDARLERDARLQSNGPSKGARRQYTADLLDATTAEGDACIHG